MCCQQCWTLSNRSQSCCVMCHQIPVFGPLFDGAVVDFACLPGLVRETAINAGNVLRSLKQFYQTLYPWHSPASSSLLYLTCVIRHVLSWQGDVQSASSLTVFRGKLKRIYFSNLIPTLSYSNRCLPQWSSKFFTWAALSSLCNIMYRVAQKVLTDPRDTTWKFKQHAAHYLGQRLEVTVWQC